MNPFTLRFLLIVVCLAAPFAAQSQEMLRARVAQQIGQFSDSAQLAKDKRNAQNVASVCAASRAAGHDFAAGVKNVRTVVDRVIAGARIEGGPFDGKFFGVPNMDSQDAKAASQHLKLKDSSLSYAPQAALAKETKPIDASMLKAQDIVLQCAGIKAFTGEDLVNGAKHPANVLDTLAKGTVVEGEAFSIPLTDSERKAVMPYLTIHEGVLKFVYKGKVEDPTPIAEEMFATYTEQVPVEGSPEAKRNAQNLSSVCAAAQAAGWDFVQDETDVAKVISKLVVGKEIPSGSFKGSFFGVPSLPLSKQQEAAAHLYVEEGVLRYSPEPRVQKSVSAESDSDL